MPNEEELAYLLAGADHHMARLVYDIFSDENCINTMQVSSQQFLTLQIRNKPISYCNDSALKMGLLTSLPCQISGVADFTAVRDKCCSMNSAVPFALPKITPPQSNVAQVILIRGPDCV